MSVIWFKGTPFCDACDELLGTEESDWGCFACGGEGFDEDQSDDDYDVWYEPDEIAARGQIVEVKP